MYTYGKSICAGALRQQDTTKDKANDKDTFLIRLISHCKGNIKYMRKLVYFGHVKHHFDYTPRLICVVCKIAHQITHL